jgi:hypothetical protein
VSSIVSRLLIEAIPLSDIMVGVNRFLVAILHL